jgi:hypothetical protein
MTDIEIDVEGVAEIVAKLDAFRAESRRLPRAFSNIKNRTHRAAYSAAPMYRGKTRDSIVSRSSNMNARIAAGGSTERSHGGGVYVVLNHFGTRWRGQQAQPWLYRTLYAQKEFARTQLENALNDKIKEVGLS